MAATVSAWAKPGAWALDAEEQEAEVRQQQKQTTDVLGEQLADFPSLAAASATKAKKKKKPQTLSIAEFSAYTSAQPTQPKGLTHEDLLNLPTGPRERTAEELDRNRLGGGFKSYGGNNRYSSNSNSDESRWGSTRDPDETRRHGSFGRDASRESAPSRADEIDDWSATKKSMPGNGFERSERRDRGGFFGSQSKADESDSWFANKREPRGFGSNGGGFERRGSFDSLSRDRGDRQVSNGSGGDDWGRKKEDSDGGVARPRLVLQPRTLPVIDDAAVAAAVAKPKTASPFGEARPREEVLAEKGKDWKEIDEKLESLKVNNKETMTERKEGSFGRSFGSGSSLADARAEKSWRKSDSVDSDSRPQSAEKSDDGSAVENGTEDAEHTEN
ncbi:hypothetical protein HS088_TW07G00961 [Tripterygium wilfordii]|uniref:Eukaryotic translation initiation factor 4B3-like n=1 Tax=Tripterygium wilfordii TaxID=458696 RepID=A0A7J7DGA0_TRIWF|nr:eukaryotic translation initiation factor 4B3-like [Tripterygium wilfordii]KAF5745377.1 hypothetical protein HS088_TW07G00961 [Tripterygium wilfordii]